LGPIEAVFLRLAHFDELPLAFRKGLKLLLGLRRKRTRLWEGSLPEEGKHLCVDLVSLHESTKRLGEPARLNRIDDNNRKIC
jgi:hypothetical protein